LEHDLNILTVGAAQKLIPLGQALNISIANVAQCESDAHPYQTGGTAPMPTVSGITPAGTTASAGPSGSATATRPATATTTTATTANKSNSAAGLSVSGVISVAAAAAAVAGLVLA